MCFRLTSWVARSGQIWKILSTRHRFVCLPVRPSVRVLAGTRLVLGRNLQFTRRRSRGDSASANQSVSVGRSVISRASVGAAVAGVCVCVCDGWRWLAAAVAALAQLLSAHSTRISSTWLSWRWESSAKAFSATFVAAGCLYTRTFCWFLGRDNQSICLSVN